MWMTLNIRSLLLLQQIGIYELRAIQKGDCFCRLRYIV